MTDEQLIEEYSKEIFGVLYTPECKITVSRLIEHSRRYRELKKDTTAGFKRGYEEGFKRGTERAEEETVSLGTLRDMTVQQLANLIGEE
jgi:flagellar biosynthesis/type III secretory pathway protein FliH